MRILNFIQQANKNKVANVDSSQQAITPKFGYMFYEPPAVTQQDTFNSTNDEENSENNISATEVSYDAEVQRVAQELLQLRNQDPDTHTFTLENGEPIGTLIDAIASINDGYPIFIMQKNSNHESSIIFAPDSETLKEELFKNDRMSVNDDSTLSIDLQGFIPSTGLLNSNCDYTVVSNTEANLEGCENFFVSSIQQLSENLIASGQTQTITEEQRHHYTDFAKALAEESFERADYQPSENELERLTEIYEGLILSVSKNDTSSEYSAPEALDLILYSIPRSVLQPEEQNTESPVTTEEGITPSTTTTTPETSTTAEAESGDNDLIQQEIDIPEFDASSTTTTTPETSTTAEAESGDNDLIQQEIDIPEFDASSTTTTTPETSTTTEAESGDNDLIQQEIDIPEFDASSTTTTTPETSTTAEAESGDNDLAQQEIDIPETVTDSTVSEDQTEPVRIHTSYVVQESDQRDLLGLNAIIADEIQYALNQIPDNDIILPESGTDEFYELVQQNEFKKIRSQIVEDSPDVNADYPDYIYPGERIVFNLEIPYEFLASIATENNSNTPNPNTEPPMPPEEYRNDEIDESQNPELEVEPDINITDPAIENLVPPQGNPEPEEILPEQIIIDPAIENLVPPQGNPEPEEILPEQIIIDPAIENLIPPQGNPETGGTPAPEINLPVASSEVSPPVISDPFVTQGFSLNDDGTYAYTVQSGDTLSSIASKYSDAGGTSIESETLANGIAYANGFSTVNDLIHPGDQLTMPSDDKIEQWIQEDKIGFTFEDGLLENNAPITTYAGTLPNATSPIDGLTSDWHGQDRGDGRTNQGDIGEFGDRPDDWAISIGATDPHTGADYGFPSGTNVNAILPGEVVHVNRTNSGSGTTVWIDHGPFISQYNHLLIDSPTVEIGEQVEQGQKIGEVGNTGVSTGSHLDLKIQVTDDAYWNELETQFSPTWESLNGGEDATRLTYHNGKRYINPDWLIWGDGPNTSPFVTSTSSPIIDADGNGLIDIENPFDSDTTNATNQVTAPVPDLSNMEGIGGLPMQGTPDSANPEITDGSGRSSGTWGEPTDTVENELRSEILTPEEAAELENEVVVINPGDSPVTPSSPPILSVEITDGIAGLSPQGVSNITTLTEEQVFDQMRLQSQLSGGYHLPVVPDETFISSTGVWGSDRGDRDHKGVDIYLPGSNGEGRGTLDSASVIPKVSYPVFAPFDGEVVAIGAANHADPLSDNYIRILGDDGFYYQFLHMHDESTINTDLQSHRDRLNYTGGGLNVGDRVSSGEIIGFVGDTGTEWEHLHFEIKTASSGGHINPLDVNSGAPEILANGFLNNYYFEGATGINSIPADVDLLDAPQEILSADDTYVTQTVPNESVVSTNGYSNHTDVQAVVAFANDIGVAPEIVAGVFAIETSREQNDTFWRGSFDPSIWGGDGGNYYGLFQMSADVRSAYGIDPKTDGNYAAQLEAFKSYLMDNGFLGEDGKVLPKWNTPELQATMMYTAVIAGEAGHEYASRSDSNGNNGYSVGERIHSGDLREQAENFLQNWNGIGSLTDENGTQIQFSSTLILNNPRKDITKIHSERKPINLLA